MYLDVFRSVEIGHLRRVFTGMMMQMSGYCYGYEINLSLNYFT